VLLSLACLVGCQGFSSGNSNQSSPPPQGLQANPASITFGSVKVGNSQSQSTTLTNSGSSAVTITQISASSSAFSSSGLSLPQTVPAGQSVSFNAIFSPSSAESTNGSLTVSSNASNSTLSIALNGTGTNQTPSAQLSVSPSSFNFGNIAVGGSQSQNGSLVANGASVTISSAPVLAAPFSIGGVSFPITIAAGQSVPFVLTFKPQAAGAASANISIISNASNSPSVEAASGTGIAAQNPISHGMFILNPPTNDGECTSPYPATCYSQHLVPTLICTGNNTPAGYNCTQAGAGEPYIKGAVFQIDWSRINPSNGTFDFSMSDDRMTDWIAAGKLVSFVFVPTSFGNSNTSTPTWYLTPVAISSVSQSSGIIQVQSSAAMGFLPGAISAAAGLEIQITGTGTALDSTSSNPGIWVVCDHNTTGCQDPTSQTIYAIGSGADIAPVVGVGAVGNPVYGSSDGSTCTSGILPIEWRPNFIKAWQAVIAQAIAHYGSNSNVAYMRFGMGIGGQSEPTNGLSSFDANQTACQAQMTEFGFTSAPAPWPNPGTSGWSQVNATWVAYLENMLQYEQAQSSPKSLLVTLSPIIYAPEDLSTIDTTAANAAASGVGIGNQGLEKSDPINYAEGNPCYGGDWCANFPKYKNEVSTEQQTLSDSDPTNSSATGSLAPTLLTFATTHGTGILEIYFDDWMCTYDSQWSGENTYAACNSAGYPTVFAAAAAQIN
jgi:hypothetical protein